MDSSVMTLLQLCDSSLPIGGFVYSQGVESAWKHGLITTLSEVEEYLLAFANQLFSFDLPFVEAGFQGGDHDQLHEVTQAYEAMVMNPLLLKGSAVMGNNLIGLFLDIKPCAFLQQRYDFFRSEGMSFHYALAFGLVSNLLKIGKPDWIKAYLYVNLRDQISAMTRLGVLGSRGSQELLSIVIQKIQKQIDLQEPVSHYSQAYKSGYLIDLAQINHHHIYSKLFQN